MSYAETLSDDLHLLRASGRYRFWFSREAKPYLIVQPVTPDGRRQFDARLDPVRQQGGGGVAGALVVSDEGRVTLCSPASPADLLGALAVFVGERIARMPALERFVGARAIRHEVDLADDAALRALDPVDAVADEGLWTSFRHDDAAQTAHTLDAMQPGDRAWYWLRAGTTPSLVMVGCAADPMMSLLTRRIDENAVDRSPSASGSARIAATGVVQFLGDALGDELLVSVARFVRDHHAAHPALARLRDARMLLLGPDRAVASVLSRPELWEGVPRPTVPGTLDYAAAVLASLGAGGTAWFWMTEHGEDGAPFVGLHAFEGKPEPARLAPQMARYRRRFPRETAPMSGVLRRQPSGALLFTTSRAGADARFPDLARELAARHPGLTTLARARLVLLEDGVVAAAVTAGGH